MAYSAEGGRQGAATGGLARDAADVGFLAASWRRVAQARKAGVAHASKKEG